MALNSSEALSSSQAVAVDSDRKFKETVYQTANFLSGGVAGILGWLFVHPLDVLKVRLQLAGETAGKKKPSTVQMAKQIVQTEGVLGLYGGLSPALLRMATYTTLRQGLYGVFKGKIVKEGEKPSLSKMALCGLMAGGVSSSLTVPIDVALVRMQADGRLPVDQRRNYKGPIDALKRIAREEGVLTYWRGATPTIARAMVINMAQLASYDQAKSMYQNMGLQGVPLHLSSSLTAGLVCTTVSLPLDITKTRMQNQKTIPGQPLQYRNIVQSMYLIAKTEGVLSLWSGFTPYFLRTGGHTIAMFMFMEQIKAQIDKHLKP